jgi:predicted kinase
MQLTERIVTERLVTERLVILVNGLPGSGKTTLGRPLARRLRLPLLSKDVIKEAHAEVFGAQPPDDRPQRDWNRMFGAAANSAMWCLLADSACGAVLESTWPAGETWELVQSGLEFAQVARPLQIWCEVPLALARQRYTLRHPSRHPVHGDEPDNEEWEERWALAAPLPIPDTLHLDTTRPVDLDQIAHWCTQRTSRGAGPLA